MKIADLIFNYDLQNNDFILRKFNKYIKNILSKEKAKNKKIKEPTNKVKKNTKAKKKRNQSS